MNKCPWCNLHNNHNVVRDTDKFTEYQCISCKGKFVKTKHETPPSKPLPLAKHRDEGRTMGFFEKFKLGNILSRKSDEEIYGCVYRELESGKIKAGLMAQAYERSNGNEDRARAIYIGLRVQSIKDDIELNNIG